MGVIQWLPQEGDKAQKHQEWAHPTAVYFIHYSIVTVAVFVGHDYLMAAAGNCVGPDMTEELRIRQHHSAIFAGTYAVLQLCSRLWTTTSHRTCVLYEGTWLCNSTLLVGSLALWLDRPTITAAFCVTVGIDQLLWYVDVLGYLLTGGKLFVIGVAKYVTWPTTPWATRLTCTHHMWTLPLFLLYAAAPVTTNSLILGAGIIVLHVSLSRLLTPFSIMGKYMNVNLSHELWKDIQIGILVINHDNPSALVYVFRLLWRWQGFNILVYFVLWKIQQWWFGGSVAVC